MQLCQRIYGSLDVFFRTQTPEDGQCSLQLLSCLL